MAQALVLFIPRTQYCCFMTLDIKSVPWLVSILPDTPTRENNWIKAVATCGVSVCLWGNVPGCWVTEVTQTQGNFAMPRAENKVSVFWEGVKHLQLPFFSSAQGRI